MPPHPAGSINTEAAVAAGFAPEVVSLMSALPFLADDHAYNHGSGCELMTSTHALSYLGEDLDKSDFEWRREMLKDGLMPPTALKITQSDVYGVEWVYDVGTGESGLQKTSQEREMRCHMHLAFFYSSLISTNEFRIKDSSHPGSPSNMIYPTQMTIPMWQPSHRAKL